MFPSELSAIWKLSVEMKGAGATPFMLHALPWFRALLTDALPSVLDGTLPALSSPADASYLPHPKAGCCGAPSLSTSRRVSVSTRLKLSIASNGIPMANAAFY